MWEWFFPTKMTPNATVIAWLGRLLHWVAAALAVVMFGYALLFIGVMLLPSIKGDDIGLLGGRKSMPNLAGLASLFGLCIYWVGRGLRYLLAHE